MVWADNFNLIADSVDMANQMLQDLTGVLHKYRMQWKPEPKRCLAGGCLANTLVTLSTTGRTSDVAQVRELEVLGSKIDVRGASGGEPQP